MLLLPLLLLGCTTLGGVIGAPGSAGKAAVVALTSSKQSSPPRLHHKAATRRGTRSANHREDDNEAAPSDNVEEAIESNAPNPEDQRAQGNELDHQVQEARHFGRLVDGDNYEDEQDIVYDFSYEVKDPQTGNDFGHRQSRAGGLTQGQYRVLLPDGRMQVVEYVSDRDGFRPSIRYEDVGVAVFAGSEQHEQFADAQQQQEDHLTSNNNNADVRRRRRRRR